MTAFQPLPGQAEPIVNTGPALIALKGFSQMLARCREAHRANPSFAEARNGQANALYDMKRYEEAVREYAAAAHLNPEPWAISLRQSSCTRLA